VSTDLQGDSFNFSAVFVERTPIRSIDISDPADVGRHDRMVELVQSMLDLHKLASAGTDHDLGQPAALKIRTGRSTWAWLYDLTEVKIGIVEDGTK
jgi:hypothetical protein